MIMFVFFYEENAGLTSPWGIWSGKCSRAEDLLMSSNCDTDVVASDESLLIRQLELSPIVFPSSVLDLWRRADDAKEKSSKHPSRSHLAER